MRIVPRAFVILLAASPLCRADGYASPPVPNTGPAPLPPQVGIDQKVGARVPLGLPFRDGTWSYTSLGSCTAGKPTILVLAYYRCPMLCNQVLNGLLRALRGVPDDVGSTFNVVVVSFDPREKPPLGAMKKANYVENYGRPGSEAGWHFLTGDSLAIERLARSVGFRYEYDAKTQQYAHGSGIMVLAPDGTVTRYLMGVRYDPAELRSALADAADGRLAPPAPNPVLLLCYAYDATTGAYTPSILKIVRLASGAVVLSIAGLIGVQVRRVRRVRGGAAA